MNGKAAEFAALLSQMETDTLTDFTAAAANLLSQLAREQQLAIHEHIDELRGA